MCSVSQSCSRVIYPGRRVNLWFWDSSSLYHNILFVISVNVDILYVPKSYVFLHLLNIQVIDLNGFVYSCVNPHATGICYMFNVIKVTDLEKGIDGLR